MDEQARANLVSWMDGFARSFGLAPGTLHRAVSYVDRVLSVRTLSTANRDYELGLLGAAAVFTAAKYEDRATICKLNAADVARYCGLATSREVIDMEREMLAALRYNLGGPTAYTLVEEDSKEDQELEIQRLASQLTGTSLLQFVPSAVAASAIFLVTCITFALFSELVSLENLQFVL